MHCSTAPPRVRLPSCRACTSCSDISGAACTATEVCDLTIQALACSSLGRRSSSSCGRRAAAGQCQPAVGARCGGEPKTRESGGCCPKPSAPHMPYLGPHIRKVWVSPKLAPLLDVAVRHLRAAAAAASGRRRGGCAAARAAPRRRCRAVRALPGSVSGRLALASIRGGQLVAWPGERPVFQLPAGGALSGREPRPAGRNSEPRGQRRRTDAARLAGAAAPATAPSPGGSVRRACPAGRASSWPAAGLTTSSVLPLLPYLRARSGHPLPRDREP